MNLLIDTHTFLWFIADSPELNENAKNQLEDDGNELFLSYASLWEMAIKLSLGKLDLPTPFDTFVNEQLRLNRIELLSLSVSQIARVASLPFHHRDPFDRLLVAQSLNEDLPLVSRDKIFDQYGVKRLWD